MMTSTPDDKERPPVAGNARPLPSRAELFGGQSGEPAIEVAPVKGLQDLVKSKQRVADHGEVFTPTWMVEEMLDLVKDESERIESRFLEPACGEGVFLVSVLRRKLTTVQSRYSKSEFERLHHGLLALMCIYGIELLEDNAEACRENLLECFASMLKVEADSVWHKAGIKVLALNIVRGDALTMTTSNNEPITFPEWGYLGKGKFQRRDFRYDALTTAYAFGEDTLFADLGKHEIFVPAQVFPPMTVEELANGN